MAEVRCPVVVLHSTEDKLVDVIQAKHTATVVPGAQLVLVDSHGHFSIEALVLPELVRVLETPPQSKPRVVRAGRFGPWS